MSSRHHITSATAIAHSLGRQIVGRTVVVTGATTGSLGGETVVTLALHKPAHLVLVGHREEESAFVRDEVKKLSTRTQVTCVPCDLADQNSVWRAARIVYRCCKHINVLINNACTLEAVPYSRTSQGIELQLGTDYIGHFLLTNLLLDKFGAGARIINMSSEAYAFSSGFNFDDYNFSEGATYDPQRAYAQSKTANILFTKALARRLAARHVSVFVLDPGVLMDTRLVVKTAPGNSKDRAKLWRARHTMKNLCPGRPKTLQQACATIIVAAFDPALEKGFSGSFLKDCCVVPTSHWANDPLVADRLWSLSEKLVGTHFVSQPMSGWSPL